MAKFHYLQVSPTGSNFGSPDASLPDAPLKINQLRKSFRGIIFYQNTTF